MAIHDQYARLWALSVYLPPRANSLADSVRQGVSEMFGITEDQSCRSLQRSQLLNSGEPAVTAKSSRQNEDQICATDRNSNGLRVLWEITTPATWSATFAWSRRNTASCLSNRYCRSPSELIDEGVETDDLGWRTARLPRHREAVATTDRTRRAGQVADQRHGPQPAGVSAVRESPTLEVSLSLQSVSEEKADHIFRKPGAFRKIVQAIDLLPRERLNVITACGTMNIDEVEHVIDWVADQRIPCISVINVFKDPSSPARFLEDCRIYKLQSDRVAGLFELIGRKREQYPGPARDPDHAVSWRSRRSVRRRTVGSVSRLQRLPAPLHAH